MIQLLLHISESSADPSSSVSKVKVTTSYSVQLIAQPFNGCPSLRSHR